MFRNSESGTSKWNLERNRRREAAFRVAHGLVINAKCKEETNDESRRLVEAAAFLHANRKNDNEPPIAIIGRIAE